MKYRTESSGIRVETISDYKPRHSKCYQVKVITPIYGGGVKAGEPDRAMPIRASAIRGQLRYWWRFLAMNRENNPLSDEAVFEVEREIWGGMGDENELEESGQIDFSSKVFIKVDAKPITDQQMTNANDIIGSNKGIDYALFSAIQGDEKHKLIKEGYSFQLTVFSQNLSIEEWESVLLSVRWWACFGGIGARTRRGLGSVEVNDISPLTQNDVQAYNCELKEINAYSAINSWSEALVKLYQFRQGVNTGRNPGSGNRPGRSRWPEPDSIREITGNEGHPIKHLARQSFPRAAFGLPIIFEFKGQAGEPPKTELIPDNSERMASPLILKAMKTNNGYKAIALKLPTDHVNFMSVTLKTSGGGNGGNLPKNFSSSEWWDVSKAKDVEPINDYNGTDALSAFMNYFTEEENN